MYYQQLGRSSCKDSLKVLESDIQHANALGSALRYAEESLMYRWGCGNLNLLPSIVIGAVLVSIVGSQSTEMNQSIDRAAAIPNSKGGARLEMKLVYNDLAPFVLFFLQWMGCSCTCFLPKYLNLFHILVCKVYEDGRPKISTRGRKASIKDFYAIILPSLQRLHYDLVELDGTTNDENRVLKSAGNKRLEGGSGLVNLDAEREDECGICLEPRTKIVLPDCCHAMCIKCYNNWNARSESCPFCRGTLTRVDSGDLWVLTSKDDVVDPKTVYAEDLRQFYLFIRNLPKDSPEVLFLMYYEYLI